LFFIFGLIFGTGIKKTAITFFERLITMEKNICVFCGSSTGNKSEYVLASQKLAKVMVEHQCNLVYGGGSVGLMGILADQVLQLGGKVLGVIPRF
jgi:predicted Rossmann-fold nucleotide-binding protein